MSVNFGRSLSIKEQKRLLEDGLAFQNPRSDDKVERVFKLDEPYLMKLLRQVVMILSWTLMLGEAAKQHYNKYCRSQEFDHEHIHVKVQTSQEKRMILITTFIRIFSIIRSKIDEIKLDAKCSSDWSQLSDEYIKEIMEKDKHTEYRKSFVCGLDIIHSFCQNCALRCFTDNLLVDYMQRVRLCQEHTTLIDKLSTRQKIVQLLDRAPQGQKLLCVLEVVWGSSYKCTLCKESGLLSVEFFQRSRHKSDCSTCELLVLDSIFSALVYAEAPKRMFAALAFSVDESKCPPNFRATAHKVGLTKWLPSSETSIWDVLFISGYYNFSDKDCFKLQSILEGRHVRSFFIYCEFQSLKSEDKAQRYCTEPQIWQYTKSLEKYLRKEAIDLTCMISAVVLEQTMCSVCEYLVEEWPKWLRNKMIFIQLYHSQLSGGTFLARLDPIIQFRSFPPSEHCNSQDLMHYDCVSNIASIWIWPTGQYNEYYISTSEIASGDYDIQEHNKPNVSPYTYYCTTVTGSNKQPCTLRKGFYRIVSGTSSYWFMQYPTSGSYKVVNVEGGNNRYLLTSDRFDQKITKRRIRKINDEWFRFPQNGVYYIQPSTDAKGYHRINIDNTIWEYYEFFPVKHVHYEFHSKPISYNWRNLKKVDGNMGRHDDTTKDTTGYKQVKDNDKTLSVENEQNESNSEDTDHKSEENEMHKLHENEQDCETPKDVVESDQKSKGDNARGKLKTGKKKNKAHARNIRKKLGKAKNKKKKKKARR